MDQKKIIQETRLYIIVALIVGFALLAAGIVLQITDSNLIANKKALVGLSFIPFAFALMNYFKLIKLLKSPEKMKHVIVDETDERLVRLRNEVDAKTFKFLRWAIFLAYMGYTFIVPTDIFESLGWWLLLILLIFSFVIQAFFAKIILSSTLPTEKEE